MSALPQSALLALTVNDLVLRYPAVLPVLNDFGIDSCCGGAKPLGEVIERHRLDATQVASELSAVVEELV